SLKVASKYPAVAKQFFTKQGVHATTIKLNGSVELAPMIDMADCIVDIVETGTNIKRNELQNITDEENINAREAENKTMFTTKTAEIQSLINSMKTSLEA